MTLPTPSTATSDPTQLGASELASAIATRRLSAIEVVNAHIRRIEQVNPALNAVVFERFELARREAAEADERVREGGALPPLLGVPITLKECLDLEGAPSTYGVESLRQPMQTDAAVVRRLREAGAIVLAKTNVAQLLLYFETDNPVFGRTNHPASNDRSPGGSSGGEAALVASHASALGIGTDLGGSVRVPAAFCGLVGFKPTAGRVPDQGRFSIPLGQQAITSQIGVLARSVDDAVLGVRVAMGQGHDGWGPLGSLDEVKVGALRVVVLEDDGILSPCPAARRAVRDAAKVLQERGARVVEAKLPDRAVLRDLFYRVMSADALRHARAVLGKTKIDPRVKQVIDSSSLPLFVIELMLTLTNRRKTIDIVRAFSDGSAAQYFATVERLTAVREEALAAMQGADVVLSPASALPALRHGAALELGTLGTYTTAWNVLGWPAGVVPFTTVRPGEESDRPASSDKADLTAQETERGSAGLPIGVQLAAPPHRDHVVLAAMKALGP